jgi:hypothetical protein
MVKVPVTQPLCQPLTNQVDKIRSFAGIDADGGGQLQRLSLGPLRVVFGDLAGFDHCIQNPVAAGDRPIRMTVRIQVAGVLDHARQQGALRQVQLADIFPEVGLGGLAETIDGKTSLLPQWNLVGVELKDLLLGKTAFQLKRDGDFNDFALEPFFRGQEKSARQLHRQGRAALTTLA